MSLVRPLLASREAELRLRDTMQQQYAFVWRSLRRLGVRPADLDDAVQEVFLVFAKRLQDVSPERERAFLFGTAVRIASNQRRAQRRSAEDPASSFDDSCALDDLDPEELSLLRRARQELQGILERMPIELRAVFVLCELEELTAPAAAELLDIPLGTVSSRLRSARFEFHSAAAAIAGRPSFRRVRT